LGVVFLWLSSKTDGISAAQKNAGIIVIILAILQFIFAIFLSTMDAKRIMKMPKNSEAAELRHVEQTEVS